MLELLKSLVFAVIMVPVVMAIILGLIYGWVKCSTSFPPLDTAKSAAIPLPRRANPFPHAHFVGVSFSAIQDLFPFCRYS